ncbi:hypothetical protein NLX62_01665 [Mycobacteriaceae bacterium Msp059]|nr:hypothetical protein [Mycobacteriaceae bacterium Msp059]
MDDKTPLDVRRAVHIRAAKANSCPRCGRNNALTRKRHADGSRVCRWEESGRCPDALPHPDGLNLGTITLCGVCHYAIVLRRFQVDYDVYGARVADLWAHMGKHGCGMHDAEEPRFLI